ncbi:MAG TPA: OsmC family protein [Tenuifilaceae bacterium]|nr:OsmC family protein [Tenuifilaceae bacterium]
MENKIDKSKELRSSIQLINEKVQFKGSVDGNNPVMIDYTPPIGDNAGYTSLELFLLSLSSCTGTAILVLLRKMQKSIQLFEISSIGNRKQEHPTGFKSVKLEINIKSENLTSDEMNKVLGMIEGICPVLSMIKGNVEVIYSFKIN